MEIVNSEKYYKWKTLNSKDPYSKECFDYAERWMNKMEEKMSDGKSVKEIALDTSFEVCEGISGFMHGVALSILENHWKYGKDIRKYVG
jgi:hypothetical protein